MCKIYYNSLATRIGPIGTADSVQAVYLIRSCQYTTPIISTYYFKSNIMKPGELFQAPKVNVPGRRVSMPIDILQATCDQVNQLRYIASCTTLLVYCTGSKLRRQDKVINSNGLAQMTRHLGVADRVSPWRGYLREDQGQDHVG